MGKLANRTGNRKTDGFGTGAGGTGHRTRTGGTGTGKMNGLIIGHSETVLVTLPLLIGKWLLITPTTT